MQKVEILIQDFESDFENFAQIQQFLKVYKQFYKFMNLQVYKWFRLYNVHTKLGLDFLSLVWCHCTLYSLWNKTRLLLKGRMSTTENCLVEEIYSSPLDAIQPEKEPIYQTPDEAKYHCRSIKFDPPPLASSSHTSSNSSFSESEPSNEVTFSLTFYCFSVK